MADMMVALLVEAMDVKMVDQLAAS